MDFSSLLRADNPYKFFFLIGAFLIVLSIYYPFKEHQQIEIKKNDVDLIYSKLIEEATYLGKEIKAQSEKTSSINKSLDSLTNLKKQHPERAQKISETINKRKNEFNKLFEELQSKEYNLKIKSLDAEYKKSEICIYEKYLNRFRLFSIALIIVGSFLFLWGGIKWYSEHKKRLEKEFS